MVGAAVASRGGGAYSQDNPLRPTSDEVEEQTGHVGRMEIPRESLTPIKPIGKGQFGEVCSTTSTTIKQFHPSIDTSHGALEFTVSTAGCWPVE